MIGRAAAMLATALLFTATTAAAQRWEWAGASGRGRGGWSEPRRFDAAQAYGRYDGFEGRGRGGFGGRYGGRRPEIAPGGAFGYGRPDPGYGGGGLRRGQVVPPAYRGAYVPDPGRYHLRAAPPGYGWVGDGRNAYLTQRSTGMVLDSVPGAYEPAPAWRRGEGGRERGPR